MKIARLKNFLNITLEDGTLLTSTKCTDELYSNVIENINDEETVKQLINPEFYKKLVQYETKKALVDDLSTSQYLTKKGTSLYLESVCQLTVPEDLATALFKAEQEGDEGLVQTYINFWTLCAHNPDSRARANLFWFLTRYGMTISKSGLFVGYRNVDIHREGSGISAADAEVISSMYTKVKFKWKKSVKAYIGYRDESNILHFTNTPSDDLSSVGNLVDMYESLKDEESTVYTDSYSGKTRIKLGVPVTMERESCDTIQEKSCSNGLHIGGKSWMSQNYFGSTGIMCLINPADVVAVPPVDNYGKLRTCAYYPVAVIKYDEYGKILDEGIEDGFEDDFLDIIINNSEMNEEDSGNYELVAPVAPELNGDVLHCNLEAIKESLAKKVVK